MAGAYDPIKSVTPVDINGNVLGAAVTTIKNPSTYEYQLVDISAPDAGRTEDMKMHKMRIGQSVRIDMTWAFPTVAEGSTLLTAFNSEYVKVNYLDLLNGVWQDRIFYVGDRNAPLYNSATGRIESIKFGIIQQTPDIITS